MADTEDEVQCALALLQTSIKHFGSDDQLVIGYKKCSPINSAIRGHKFLKESGYVTATVRVGTFVCAPYRNLADVVNAIHRKYNTTLHQALYSVNGSAAPRRARTGPNTRPHTSTTTSTSVHTRAGRSVSATPRTRIRRHSAEVVHVSSSSDEAPDLDSDEDQRTSEYRTSDYRTSDYRTSDYRTSDYRTSDYRTSDYRTSDYRTHQTRSRGYIHDSPSREDSAEIEDEVDVEMDSAEIMNTSDLREDSDEDEMMTRVNQSTAEQLSMRGRFELQQQKFVKDFNARSGHHDIMMTIKLFGATIPVPKNTIVFPPLRDLYEEQ